MFNLLRMDLRRLLKSRSFKTILVVTAALILMVSLMAAMVSDPEMLDKKALYTHTCAGCGRKFTAYGNSRRKYCSHACYTRTGLEEAWQMTEEQFRAEKLYYTGKGRFRLQNATTASIASPASFAMLAYP